MFYVKLHKSSNPDKKYMVVINYTKTNQEHKATVHFGDSEMSDYTLHKDPARKRNYITRHKTNENWKISGIETAGFWSRWLLWNKPTIKESKTDITKKFDVVFI